MALQLQPFLFLLFSIVVFCGICLGQTKDESHREEGYPVKMEAENEPYWKRYWLPKNDRTLIRKNTVQFYEAGSLVFETKFYQSDILDNLEVEICYKNDWNKKIESCKPQKGLFFKKIESIEKRMEFKLWKSSKQEKEISKIIKVEGGKKICREKTPERKEQIYFIVKGIEKENGQRQIQHFKIALVKELGMRIVEVRNTVKVNKTANLFKEQQHLQISYNEIAFLINCHQQIMFNPNKSEALDVVSKFLQIQISIEECLKKNGFGRKMAEYQQKIFSLTKLDDWIEKEKDKAENDVLQRNNRITNRVCWRFGKVIKFAYYLVANELLSNFLLKKLEFGTDPKINSVIDYGRYKWWQRHLTNQLINLQYLLRDELNERIKKERTNFSDKWFRKLIDDISNLVENETTIVSAAEDDPLPTHFEPFWFTNGREYPKAKRVLWLVRHNERMDNVDKDYKENAKKEPQMVDGREIHWDNCLLSEWGQKEQGRKLNEAFQNVPIDHLFASPLDRTIQTASHLLGKMDHKGIKIKLEAGIIECLRHCKNPPTYRKCEEQRQQYTRLECDYQSLFVKDEHSRTDNQIVLPCEKEDVPDYENELAKRVETILKHILDETENKSSRADVKEEEQIKIPNEWVAPWEDKAQHIVVVTHGVFIGAAHKVISGHGEFTPLGTINKFVEFDESASSSTSDNPLNNFRVILTGESMHFGKDVRQFLGI